MSIAETSIDYFTAVARFRAEWPVTTNPFEVAGRDIDGHLVERVDNQGEPCPLCAETDAPIEVTVTGISPFAFVRTSQDCCVRCARTAVAETLWSERAIVEVARV